MAVSNLLERFNYSKQQHPVSLFVSASQVAVGFDKEGTAQVASCPVTSDPWLTARELLNKLAFRKMAVNVVLGHGLYQSLLIDDPGLSEQDKCFALPFHIRDLISSNPSDIVADGYALPILNRYQVFVTPKAPLLQFCNDLKKRHCRINCVSVESVVLRLWTQLDKTEMVLSQDGLGVVQLSVFCEGKLCFLRQIRGMTLEDNASLQSPIIEDLVLEIQRSLDYLQGQLKTVQISGLVVSLQGIDNNELAFELLSRLPVPVRSQTMFEHGDHFQHITLAALKKDFSPYINLMLCGDSLTVKPVLSFGRMILFWSASMMLIGLGVAHQQLTITQAEMALTLSLAELHEVQRLGEELDERLALHLPSLALVSELEHTEKVLADKRSALEAVTQHDAALQQGYVAVFNALTSLSRPDISVSQIFVSLAELNLEGISSKPEAVPSWLRSFQTEPALSTRVFELMELTREENNRLNFNLKSKRGKAEGTQ